MRQKFSYILALAALALLLLHQWVPHCHCPDGQKTEVCSLVSEDSHNMLSEIFGTDIGANHLENYEIAKTQTVKAKFFAVILAILPMPVNSLTVIGTHYSFDFIPPLFKGYLVSYPVRPPPSV